MRNTLLFASIVAVIISSTLSPLADENRPQATGVEKRLLKIELNIAIKQYKRVCAQLSEMYFQDRFPQADDRPEKEVQLRDQQEAFLAQQRDRLRAQILEMGKKIEKLETTTKKDK